MKEEYDFSKGKRGPVIPPDPRKSRITIRMDSDIIEWFRNEVNQAGGGNYQTLINAALREHIHRHDGRTWEETLRQIIREELRAAG